jgi:hypothetical protein
VPFRTLNCDAVKCNAEADMSVIITFPNVRNLRLVVIDILTGLFDDVAIILFASNKSIVLNDDDNIPPEVPAGKATLDVVAVNVPTSILFALILSSLVSVLAEINALLVT